MALAHQYTSDGYYHGSQECSGLLPNNATYVGPEVKDGFIPKWNGKTWEQVENHKGWEGWLGGERFTMKDFGPLPKGATKEAPEPSAEEKAAQIRAKRDGLITATDYLMMPDYPISEEERTVLAEYRQALRDVTLQPGFPDSVIWPER